MEKPRNWLNFRYSLVFLLVFVNVFCLVLPALLKSMSTEHYGLLNGAQATFGTLMGLAIKYYFDERRVEEAHRHNEKAE